MLEEALSNPSSPPAETALALLSFLRDELPAGGSAAEARFLRLFPVLIQRVFGELDENGDDDRNGGGGGGGGTADGKENRSGGNQTSAGDEKKTTATNGVRGAGGTGTAKTTTTVAAVKEGSAIRHKEGGWLSRRDRWDYRGPGAPSSSSSSPHYGPATTSQPRPSIQSDPVVRLLSASPSPSAYYPRRGSDDGRRRPPQSHQTGGGRGGAAPPPFQPTLIDTLLSGGGGKSAPSVRYGYPFLALPGPTRDALRSVLIQLTSEAQQAQTQQAQWGGGGGQQRSYNNYHQSRPSPLGMTTTASGLSTAAADASGRANAAKLWSAVFRVPPSHQHDALSYLRWEDQQRQQQLVASRGGMYHPHPGTASAAAPWGPLSQRPLSPRTALPSPRYPHQATLSSPSPSSAHGVGVGSPSSDGKRNRHPRVALGMLEYYLLSFVRFPLALPTASSDGYDNGGGGSYAGGGTGIYRHRRRDVPYGERAYAHLLRTYWSRFLPFTVDPNDAAVEDYDNSFGSGYSLRAFRGGSSSSSSSMTGGRRSPVRNKIDFADARLDAESELFLRLVLELWVEGDNRAPTTDDAVRRLASLRTTSDHGAGGADGGVVLGAASSSFSSSMAPAFGVVATEIPGLDASYDLASLVAMGSARTPMTGTTGTRYVPPPPLVLSGIRGLVRHLVCDPGVRRGAFSAYARSTDGHGETAAASLPSPATTSPSSSSSAVGWPLPPAMTATQPSLYAHVRTALRHAPIHPYRPDGPFYAALDAWLTWIEPWNATIKRRVVSSSSSSSSSSGTYGGMGASSSSMNSTSSSSPSHLLRRAASVAAHPSSATEAYVAIVPPRSSPSPVPSPSMTYASRYSPEWEPYVASNLHLYTVPLAIFLRRARELDFGTEYHRSLSVVQRVMRAYDPRLVRAIESMLPPSEGGGHRPTRSFVALVERHERNLRAFCPPTTPFSSTPGLTACRRDMQSLLEEVHLQQRKRVRDMDALDRFGSWIEGLAGGGARGERAALDRLVERARIVAALPEEYVPLPEEECEGAGAAGGRWWPFGSGGSGGRGRAGAGADEMGRPERVSGGAPFLTERGREQVLMGSRKCSALDIPYLGDPMAARVKSYEVPFLVVWTVRASNWINGRLGLSGSASPPGAADAQTRRDWTGRLPGDQDADATTVLLRLLQEGESSRKVWFRVNLRFLADYRNILFISLVAFIWKSFQ